MDNNGCELDKRRGEYCSSCDNYDKDNHYCPYFCDVIKEAVKDLNDFRGYWKIRRGCDGAEAYYTCSECGWHDRLKTYYCSHCGAKMENGKE